MYFSIKARETAARCFEAFNLVRDRASRIHVPGSRCQLYYVRPESVFVKFGDIEAEKYYAGVEQQKKLAEEERKSFKQSQPKFEKSQSYQGQKYGGGKGGRDQPEADDRQYTRERREKKGGYHQPTEEEHQQAFKELKSDKQGGVRPTFMNTRKVTNVPVQEELKEESHRTVTDTSKVPQKIHKKHFVATDHKEVEEYDVEEVRAEEYTPKDQPAGTFDDQSP